MEEGADRVACPVSKHTGSYSRLNAMDPGEDKYEISPWKFAKHHLYDQSRIEKAWDIFLTKGSGRHMRQENRERVWKGILHYCTRFRQGYVCVESPICLLWMRDVRDDIEGLEVDLQYLENIPPHEALKEMTRDEIETCHSSIPCYWCGSSEHSVLGNDLEGQRKVITCPLAKGETVSKESILPSPKSFLECSSLDLDQLEEALDLFSFQGIGWHHDVPTMKEYRKLVLNYCYDIRSQWTFKRTSLSDCFNEEELEDDTICA